MRNILITAAFLLLATLPLRSQSDEPVWVRGGAGGSVSAAAVLPDGIRGISLSDYGDLVVWNLGSGAPLMRLRPDSRWIYSFAVASDGAMVATVGDDRTIRVRDISTFEVTKTLTGYPGLWATLAWSSDGRLLASGHDNGTVMVWRLDSGTVVDSFRAESGSVGNLKFIGNDSIPTVG